MVFDKTVQALVVEEGMSRSAQPVEDRISLRKEALFSVVSLK